MKSKKILALVMAMTIGLSGFSSMFAADTTAPASGSTQAQQVAGEAVELPAKLASASYSDASQGVVLKANTDPLKIDGQMTGETYGGAWIEFQVSVPANGDYLFTARVQSPAGAKPQMDVLVDGELALTVEEGDPAGESLPWMTTTPQALSMKKGEHTIRLVFSSDFEMSWMQLASAVEPIEISDSTVIPVMDYARISKENVETESGDDPQVPGGLIPKYMMAGDWLEYEVTVPEEAAGAYNLVMNVARAGTDDGAIGLQCYVDGTLAGQISRAGTGGWKSWVPSDELELDLSAGVHTIKLVYTRQFNMSMLKFTEAVKGDKRFKIDAVSYSKASKTLKTEEANNPEVESGLIPAGTYAGDWLEYTIDVPENMAGKYYLTMQVARAGTAPGDIKIKAHLDGVQVMDYVRAGTGGWKAWAETDAALVNLTAGTHTLKVSFVSQFNLSLLKFEQEKEIGNSIKVEASTFSRASGNIGLENCQDPEVTSGKNPTSTMAGTWLEYNINVPKKLEGDFKLSMHVARATTEPDLIGLEAYIDGELAAIVSHDGTGGWQNWQATEPVGVNLTAGSHVVRILFTKQFNLSLLKFEQLEVDPDAKVSEITVQTQEPQAIKGKTTSFFATVKGDENCDPFVTWEVEGAESAKISAYGLLSVSFGDPAAFVTVRARSRSNPEVVSAPVTIPLIDESTEHGRLSREIAEEGMVLLKNENGALPLRAETNVALLGIGQASYVKGGSGSGDVESAYVRTIQEGLLDKAANKKIKLYEPLTDYYSQYYTRVGGGYGTDEPEMNGELARLVDEAAAQENATAVVVLRRRTGEGSDIGIKAGEYYLRSREKELIQTALDKFDRVVVVLNIGVVMDVNWLNTIQSSDGRSVDAVFLAWQPGMEGGVAVANALCGEVNPSGRLTDTFVTSFDDYPSANVYENAGRNAWVSYEEDIFVGYRYFETFAKDKVIFPFGFGLSYTTFDIHDVNAVANPEKGVIDVSATVTNTGDLAGKEVVQTYFSAPAGDLPKPALELAAFQKTELLQPGASQTVTMSFDIADMASYDDVGKTGAESAFVWEPGAYKILVGSNVRDTQQAGVYTVDKLEVAEQLTKAFQPANPDKMLERRLDGKGPDSYETTVWSDSEKPDAQSMQPEPTRAQMNNAARAVQTSGETIMLADVAENPALMTAFLEQLSDDQLIILSRGTGSDNPREIVDGANTACTKEVLEFGIPRLQTADGPAGIRNNKYTATAWPCATLQACTWNPDLIEAAGQAGAEEAKTFKTLDKYKNLSMGNDGFPIWLTPSTNIHRNPRCGRNFEYYSEDPFIAGKMAAAQIRGIQSEGVSATLKHFSANNSENYRKNSDSMVSERAMREIYLRPFEIAVKESQPWCVMSSYNLINGVRAAESVDLLTQVLRNEWNFKGMVMTDWGSESTLVEEIKAGGDLKMPSSGSDNDPAGAPGSLQLQAVRDALADGSLSRKTLERNIRSTMRMILHTYFFDGDKEALDVYNPVDVASAPGVIAATDFRFYYENEPVSLHVTQAEGSGPVQAVSVVDADGNAVDVTKLADGEYSFVMPASAVTVYTEQKEADPQLLNVQWNPSQADVEIAGEADVLIDGNGIYGATVVPGTKLTLTFTPANGPFASAQLNGEDIPFEADGFTYTYTMPNDKTVLRFTFTSVNKDVLETLLEKANEVTDEQLDKLVESVRKKFIAARDNAQKAFESDKATQDEVNEAWKELLDAMHYLSFEEGTKDKMEYWLDYAAQLDLDNFTPKSQEGYAEALAYAEEIYNDEGETLKAEVEKAAKNLYDAIMRLTFKANTETLALFVQQAQEIDPDAYLDGPEKDKFNEILPQAEAVLADANATQKQVDEMADKLFDALTGLRVTPDREALKALLEESEALNPADYTEASYAILRAALNLAWDTCKDDAATPKDVAVQYATVEKARAGLVLTDKPEEPAKPDNKPSSKPSNSGSKRPSGNVSGAGTAVAVTSPVVSAAQNVMGQKSVRSDTTMNFTLKRGSAYCFKMTVVNGSNTAPNFTVGNGSVLKTQFVAKIGNDCYYRVWAVGTPGQSTGVYTTMSNEEPQKHCVITIA
ncbi:carbohydrate-binding protein [Clostridium sp. D33t1_170424_F3]|uniref:carbohydrate-binding protein n=1 Tax=Clostridium sp. D33t1_170424_F3 TaxID=2787099 RepID=UPI0018AA2768|nr:carbohydrate-binding protein [Clostridium sp. D33t1_170424_F3]